MKNTLGTLPDMIGPVLSSVSWLVCLVIPISIHPSFIILPFATLLGLAITATVGTFKK